MLKGVSILAVLLAPFCSGAVYYVDATGGNDGASGLSGFPWQTLTHAETQTFSPGDSLLLKRGETWTGKFTVPTNYFTLDAYGTGDLPIIDGENVNRRIVDLGVMTNTVTRHLHLKNGGGGTGAIWSAQVGTNTVSDCVLEHHASDAAASAADGACIIVSNCFISDTFDDGVTMHSTSGNTKSFVSSCTFSNCSQAINHSGTSLMNMTLTDSVFIENQTDIGPLSNCATEISRCWFKGGTATSKMYQGGEATVTFNYCIFDGSHSGTAAAPEWMPGAASTTIANNCVFFGANTGKIGILDTSTLNLTNCIFYGWWGAPQYINAGGILNSDHAIISSVTYSNSTSQTSFVSAANPLFVNAATGDFHLTPGSPALNAGIYTGQMLDLDRKLIRNPPDLGAYEYLIVSRALNLRAGFLRGK